MTSTLHSEILQVIQSHSAEEAVRLAALAAAAPSDVWTERAWLTVAAAANSSASSDARWLALCIFAHEKRGANVAAVDALLKRARFLVVSGPEANDQFRDPAIFFEGVRRFIGGDSAQTALGTFQRAVDQVFKADRKSIEWSDARTQFIRGRRLRELGRALRSVADQGIVVPTDLADWLPWADVREVDGKVIA